MEKFVCMICNEKFDNSGRRPYVATCGHSVCAECNRDVVGKLKGSCPKNDGGSFEAVKGGSVNYLAADMMKVLRKLDEDNTRKDQKLAELEKQLQREKDKQTRYLSAEKNRKTECLVDYIHKLDFSFSVDFCHDYSNTITKPEFFSCTWTWSVDRSEFAILKATLRLEIENLSKYIYGVIFKVTGKRDDNTGVESTQQYIKILIDKPEKVIVFEMETFVDNLKPVHLHFKIELKLRTTQDRDRREKLEKELSQLEAININSKDASRKMVELAKQCTKWEDDILNKIREKMKSLEKLRTEQAIESTPDPVQVKRRKCGNR